MPVEHVHFVHRHKIEKLAHRLLAKEMPAFVQKDAAPSIGRRILDLNTRIAPALFCLLRKLKERLAGIERTRLVG